MTGCAHGHRAVSASSPYSSANAGTASGSTFATGTFSFPPLHGGLLSRGPMSSSPAPSRTDVGGKCCCFRFVLLLEWICCFVLYA